MDGLCPMGRLGVVGGPQAPNSNIGVSTIKVYDITEITLVFKLIIIILNTECSV